MFLGQFRHSLDTKGRLIIPSNFRKDLDKVLFLTRGVERCIFAYPEDAWEEMYQKISSLSLTRKETREFARVFLASASREEMDVQGRIIIPPYLRGYAQIKDKVVVVGVGARFEVWSESLWDPYVTGLEDKFSQIAESIVDTGL
ncbi:MAG: transcriptional regulator MraZ [Candidatus Atribacteria bacterium]|nr:transcriptional regulator MraZ [Candidatus Atribacteria bacterium]